MSHPFKSINDEQTKEIQMQDFYNSLDAHLKGEYRVMQTYRSVFSELQDVSVNLDVGDLETSIGYTLTTIDKFLTGHPHMLDVVHSFPVFNKVLETMILETKIELSEHDGGDLIY